MCNMMICNTAIFRRLEINAWCLPSLRRPYATLPLSHTAPYPTLPHCHTATLSICHTAPAPATHGSPPLAVKVFNAETSQVFTINAPIHPPLPCLCLPLPCCLIYKLPISTYSGRKIAVLAKSTFAQSQNVISQRDFTNRSMAFLQTNCRQTHPLTPTDHVCIKPSEGSHLWFHIGSN